MKIYNTTVTSNTQKILEYRKESWYKTIFKHSNVLVYFPTWKKKIEKFQMDFIITTNTF